MEQVYKSRTKHKRDSDANWEQADPVLLYGEIILVDTEEGELRAKVGDGVQTYKQLPFSDEVLRALISEHTHSNYASKVTMSGSGNAITDITQSGNTITASKGTTFLTEHPTITKSTDSTSTASPSHGGVFTAVDSITRDSNGHVTKVNTKTVTLPSDNNTDTKVIQTLTSSNANYPLLLAPNGQTATTTTMSYFDSGVTLNPSTNTIAANISGNAATATSATSATSATKATQDSAGQQINTTYIKALSVSGKVITYTRGDGTTGTITTQDTNTTYSLSSFGITSTATELNYTDGVTSNIQTQLNNKAPAYQYSTTDLTAGSSSLTTGTLYFVYE